MAIVRSVVFSVGASILATLAARYFVSVTEPDGRQDRQKSGIGSVVVVMPVLVGNSGNRIGWVKEVHHHHHSLFRRPNRKHGA